MTRLMQNYFNRQKDEVESEKREYEARLARIEHLLVHDGMRDLREFLKLALQQNRPKPGAAESVNYQLGVRDGIEIVVGQLDAWTQEIKNARD